LPRLRLAMTGKREAGNDIAKRLAMTGKREARNDTLLVVDSGHEGVIGEDGLLVGERGLKGDKTS